MTKMVLDVGNCAPDHAAIRNYIEGRFDARVMQSDAWSDTAAILEREPVDLILVNRKLDVDYSDGLEMVRRLKASPKWSSIPVMLVTNYEEHQRLAVQEGALPGFGKLELTLPRTEERIGQALGYAVS
jgi:CheY-like chemotaxis protein